MSAIAGLCFLDDRRIDPADLERMLTRLAHRGPDARGVWHGVSASLGHAMLRTTIESYGETLPLRDDAAGLVITADARIDNRTELIAELGLTRRAPAEIADSELILRAYEKWGDDCPRKLLGDFAFAIWDERKQALFCARDHFGARPFYYHHSDRRFVFASEIKGLLNLPYVPRRLNEVRVADYLASLLEDTAITFYDGILRLPPAHSLTVSRDGFSLRSYWALDPTRQIRYRSDDAYAEAFRELFTEAVRCRMRGLQPVGVMLSGGLDSSSIVGVARRILEPNRGPLHTFSAAFDDTPACDEREYLNAVLAQPGLQPHTLGAPDIPSATLLETMLKEQDEPFLYAFVFVYSVLYRHARQAGVRTVLDGVDGDTTVSHGLSLLAELVGSLRLVALARESRALSRRFKRPARSFLVQYGLRPWIPERLWQMRHSEQREPWHVACGDVLAADFARRIGMPERFEQQGGYCWAPSRTARQSHFRRLSSGGFALTLESLDRAGASQSVQASHPFFDKRLVEFCLALPPRQQLDNGWTRVILRRALKDDLPAAVRSNGGKASLSPAFARGLLNFDDRSLGSSVEQSISVLGPYLNAAAVRTMAEQVRSQQSAGDALYLWRVVSLAAWMRQSGLAAA